MEKFGYIIKPFIQEGGYMPQIFDAIVIGAGIMGCSTGLQLAEQGLKVAILEKSVVGTASSGKSSAIIRQHYSNEVTARMALQSLRTFQHFKDKVGGECGFNQTGFLLMTPEKDSEGLRANVALQQKVGIQTSILSRAEIRKRWPHYEIGDLVEAAFEPEAGYADPTLTLNSYVEAFRRAGGHLFQETEVTSMRLKGGKIIGVDAPQDAFDAPLVINCGGAWGGRISKMAGVEVPIKSCRVQVAFFRRPPEHQAEHPVIADFVNAVYWRSETGGLTMVGLIDPEEEKYVVDPDAYNERVDFDFIADAGERLVRRFPSLKDAESTGGFAALYAITPDWHPIMDELVPGSGLYICAGFSGHGFKLGPAVGVMIADMVTGQTAPGLERKMFRLNRYVEDDPVRGQYDYSIVG
jgi:sarcosine oxidase subunit beta